MNRKNLLPDYFLDITQDVCPMTFVKARLQIEKMNQGEVLQIRLLGDEPLKNVPDSLTELGHLIVALDRERSDGDRYTLLVEKK
jgi:tRNA 2-thiouridine synthesizing protein A